MSNNLLPVNRSLLEQAISQSAARIEQTPINNAWLWDPDNCPEHFLAWYAHSVSVDIWDNHWDEQTKRKVAKDSVPMHRVKGTKKSLETAIDLLGVKAEVIEDWQTDGISHSAKIVANTQDNTNDGSSKLTPKLQAQLWRAIEITKPLRVQMQLQIKSAHKAEAQLGSTGCSTQLQRDTWTQVPHYAFTPTSMTAVSTHRADVVTRQNFSATPDTQLGQPVQLQAAQLSYFINNTTMVCQ